MKKQPSSSTKQMQILLISSGISTLGLFLSFPLINIYFTEKFGLLPTDIGLISGIMPITILLLSFIVGGVVERIGYSYGLSLGVFINILAFLILGISKIGYLCYFSLFLMGVGKTFFDNAIKSKMIFLTKDSNEIEKYFRIRYLLQNIGNAIGPLIGIFFFEIIYGKTFLITAFLFCIIFILVLVAHKNPINYQTIKRDNSLFSELTSITEQIYILRDKKFQLWILSSFFIIMGYGAYEELMPLISFNSNGGRPPFGVLVSLNSVIVVISQFFIIKFFNKNSLNRNVNIGFSLLMLGFLILIVPIYSQFFTYFAVVIFSIGESITFPFYDTLMGVIATEDKRAVYYGIGEIKQLGFFIGPLIGSIVFSFYNETIFFIICAIFSILSWLFLKKLNNLCEIK